MSNGRSRAWVVYAVLAVMVAIGSIVSPEGRGGAALVALLLGLYAWYLYQGGRFVFMPIPGCLIVLLLTGTGLVLGTVSLIG